MNTNKNLMQANDNLDEAAHHQKKSKKKYICLVIMIIIILIIVAGVIFILTSNWSFPTFCFILQWLSAIHFLYSLRSWIKEFNNYLMEIEQYADDYKIHLLLGEGGQAKYPSKHSVSILAPRMATLSLSRSISQAPAKKKPLRLR